MSELLYCKVIGSFKGFVADTTQDEDDLPEFNIPTGTGVIVPNVKIVKYASEDQGKIIFSPSLLSFPWIRPPQPEDPLGHYP